MIDIDRAESSRPFASGLGVARPRSEPRPPLRPCSSSGASMLDGLFAAPDHPRGGRCITSTLRWAIGGRRPWTRTRRLVKPEGRLPHWHSRSCADGRLLEPKKVDRP